MDFVQALHDGVFAKFDQAIADHKAKWEAVPELKKALETDLKRKGVVVDRCPILYCRQDVSIGYDGDGFPTTQKTAFGDIF